MFCAGAWSDRLALRCGARLEYRILPFRGAYLQLRTERSELVRGLIYPVPDPRLPFLGVHISRHIDGRVTIGPTALPVFSRTAYRLRKVRLPDVVDSLRWPGTWRMARCWWRTGLTEIADALSRRALVTKARAYVPALELGDFTQQTEAGIRAQAVAREDQLVALKVDRVRQLTEHLPDELIRVPRMVQDPRELLVRAERRPVGHTTSIRPLPTIIGRRRPTSVAARCPGTTPGGVRRTKPPGSGRPAQRLGGGAGAARLLVYMPATMSFGRRRATAAIER